MIKLWKIYHEKIEVVCFVIRVWYNVDGPYEINIMKNYSDWLSLLFYLYIETY